MLEHRFEHILAITFTNKAANGMKERLLSQIHAVAEGGATQLCQEMASHLDIVTAEVRRRCAILQSAILHHYSDLSVCTIDSFVHRLVRTFAHDLRLPMNFDVLIDNQQIIQSSVDELLALAGTDGQKALTEVLCAYTQSRMDSGKSYNIESQIADLAKELFKEETPHYLEALDRVELNDYIDIHKWLAKECRATEERLTAAAAELIDALRREGLSPDDFPYKRSGALSLFLHLADGDFSKLNDPHKRADDACSKGLWSSKTPADIKSRMQNLMPVYKRAYDNVMAILQSELSTYNSRQLLLSNIFALALLSRLGKIKDTFYKDNEIVHISEFNKRIANEVMNEPTPFIYERIGSHYYNYMIDEFQDTSKLQWSNFLPLFDEAMTHLFSSDTALPGTQSLVVGDGKQAIYRFRQGDVRQFMMLPQVDSPLHGHSLAGNASVVPLNRNFRTLGNIVRFNNRFFESVVRNRFAPSCTNAGNPELAKLYLGDGPQADLLQQPVKEGGYVQVSFCDKDQLFEQILATIRHQVDDLHFNYGDIMVLARDNDTLVKISDYIIANSTGDPSTRPVPIVSSESFLLSGSTEVLFLQSLLEYIYNPLNRIAALQAVRFMPSAAPNLEWLLKDCNFDLASLVNTHCSVQQSFNVDYLRTLPLYDLCETLIRIFALDGSGDRFLATFLNVVNNYTLKNRSDLGDFISYLADKIDRISSSTASDLDAVQLMTIHKAKGLESKIVIYALPDKRTPNSKLWVEVDEQHIGEMRLPVAFVGTQKNSTIFERSFNEEARLSDMDRINVLYVAMTRPEEKLFVFCDDVQHSDDSTGNIALLRDFVHNDKETTRVGDTLFVVGDDAPCRPKVDAADAKATIAVSSIRYPEWEDRVSIARQSAALLSPFDEDNRRYGILIHDLLSHIRVADDIDAVVGSYCSGHDLDDGVRDAVSGRIKAMVYKEENRRFFDPACRVKCEASIAAGGMVRRPDRIVFAADATYVVDFKTGSRNPQSHAKYQLQVSEYADLLSSMGYPNVVPVIVYL